MAGEGQTLYRWTNDMYLMLADHLTQVAHCKFRTMRTFCKSCTSSTVSGNGCLESHRPPDLTILSCRQKQTRHTQDPDAAHQSLPSKLSISWTLEFFQKPSLSRSRATFEKSRPGRSLTFPHSELLFPVIIACHKRTESGAS